MQGLPSILSLFRNEFNKFNNTRARMLDSIYHKINNHQPLYSKWIRTIRSGNFIGHKWVYTYMYIKTCLKRPLKKDQNLFLRPLIALCRSKVLQNAPILQYVRPSFRYHLSLRYLFCLVCFEWQLKAVFNVHV